ncbi:MAG: hypothetical protein ACI9N1_001895 [Flavobacteriales bacterium]|jgi:hypothetical protein
MIKMNIIKSILVMAGVTLGSHIHSQYSIIGQVYTDNDEILVTGNVLSYRAIDSSFITGGTILNGIFELYQIEEEQIILKIKSLETIDLYINVTHSDSSSIIDLGRINVPTSMQLGEVEITGYIPLYELDGTTTKVNVEKTILGESVTPMEILKKSPGIIVKDDAISLIGRGNAIIYADGQQISSDQFNMIPVNQIIKIEIIKDPSAKYGSEAGAVINVITKNYYREGAQLNIRQSFLIPTLLSSTSIGLNFEKKKWLIQANYSGTIGNTWNTVIRNTERSGAYRTELNLEEESIIQKHNGSLGVSYKIDSNSTITFEYQGSIADIGVQVNSQNKVFSNQYTEYDAFNTGTVDLRNNSVIGNYKKSIDTLGSGFFIGMQYAGYYLGLEERISEDINIDNIPNGNKRRNIESNNTINLLSGQLDYQKFFTTTLSLSAGVRYSNSINTGDLSMNNLIGDELVFVPSYSSSTQFREHLIAGYGEINQKVGTFGIRAGLRFERTIAEGLTTQENQMSLSRTYNWFIPSILISKQLNEYVSLNLSYNINTGRPSYNDLDPKVFYIDSLTSKQGNPLLLPQLDHSIKLAANLGMLQLDATFYKSINAFKNITREGLGGVNSIVLFKENVNADRFYVSATLPYQNKIMSAYFNYSLNLDKVTGSQSDFSNIDLKPNHYFYFFAQLKVKKVVNIEFIGNYFSGRYDGIYRDQNSYGISIGLSKSFLNDQLKCSILANDIFFSERDAGTYYIGEYSVTYLDKSYTQYLRFSLNYSFGKLKERNYQSVDVGSDEKQRVK